MHHLATSFGKKSWKNPVDLGFVRVNYSSVMHDSAPPKQILGPNILRIVTKPDPKSWFSFDVSPRSIKPTAYMIRHYSSWDTEAVRNWQFEVSCSLFITSPFFSPYIIRVLMIIYVGQL